MGISRKRAMFIKMSCSGFFSAHFLGNLKNASYFLKKSDLYIAKATLRLADAIMWQLGTVHYFNQFISFNFASTALRKNL